MLGLYATQCYRHLHLKKHFLKCMNSERATEIALMIVTFSCRVVQNAIEVQCLPS